jgi:hypothetical protein
MSGRITMGMHAPAASDVSVNIGYGDGIQSHLKIAGLTIYTQARSLPYEQGLRFVQALREAVEKTEEYLLNLRNLDANGDEITWTGCGCDADFVEGRYVAHLCNYPPCVMDRETVNPWGISNATKLVGWAK